MADWLIERLDRSHERDPFSCGNPVLDEFLRRLVSQYEKRNLGRNYVAVQPPSKQVLGYYTLASGSVAFQNVPDPAAKKLPHHPIPVVLLARLAVEHSLHGQGHGEALLIDALRRCLRVAEELGVHAVEVDAIDEHAKAFYEKYGFAALLDSPLHLFLPVATIRQAF